MVYNKTCYGEEAASAVTSITPCSIASAVETSDPTAAYRLGADNKLQNSFNGSIDFIREYYSLAAAPNEIYSEKEDIEDVKEEVLIGDLDKNEKINVFDLIILKRKVASGAVSYAIADTDGNGTLDTADIKNMNNYLLKLINSFPAGNTVMI